MTLAQPVMFVMINFFSGFEAIKFQLLSRSMYKRIVRYIYEVKIVLVVFS